jgi:hypothetical protein
MIALAVRRIASESAPDGVAEPVLVAPVSSAKVPASTEVLPHGTPEQENERVKELEKMELAKRQRDHAAENTHKARTQVQFYKYIAWRKVIDAQMPVFEALRKEAAHSHDKVVPCTICQGQSVLELCVVCDHTGKCPTCHGTGKDFGEVCPACVGSGKCFLCSGSGKMPCPFCSLLKDEGMITPDSPNPPIEIPIN